MAYLLIYKAGLGLTGQAFSFDIMWTFNLIVMRWYVKRFDPIPGIFFKVERDSFREICSLFKFELIIGSMTWADFVAIEIMNLLVGGLSNVEVAAFTVAGTAYRLPYPIAISVSIANNALVGNAIGEKDIQKTKKLIKFSTIFNLLTALFLAIILLIHIHAVTEFLSTSAESA
mmetsp:Transcript_11628/g.10122  ORF Transcript_11628/g.10122 Transcript_11628/m.10122 type:complete len:173 (-) Transcript_11628:529-1047(-)